ncbi:hypothetical protein RIF29_00526 [Crotalaria pallida]|uniref:Uncharacterized protein n=1 Tax=Crotalaria pallida TaxID=3830 RepID=A0AAN9P792_CROPI
MVGDVNQQTNLVHKAPKKEGELDAVAVVHSYEDKVSAGSHKTRLTALNLCIFYRFLSLFTPGFCRCTMLCS